MGGVVRKTGMIALGAALALGCQSSRKTPYADNPLLMSREPLLQTTNNTKTTSATEVKPTTLPNTSPQAKSWSAPVKQASNVSAVPIPDGPQLPVGGETLTIKPPPPAPPTIIVPPPEPAKNLASNEPVFTPSKAPFHLPTPPAAPTTAKDTAVMPVSYQRFGHAPDYSWLQGEFDIHYRGFKELRFRPSSEEDTFGGKVRLVDDARLNEFKPGDVVRVEGELVRDETNGGQYPRYHVKSIQLMEQKPSK